jgi:hypothetical protein
LAAICKEELAELLVFLNVPLPENWSKPDLPPWELEQTSHVASDPEQLDKVDGTSDALPQESAGDHASRTLILFDMDALGIGAPTSSEIEAIVRHFSQLSETIDPESDLVKCFQLTPIDVEEIKGILQKGHPSDVRDVICEWVRDHATSEWPPGDTETTQAEDPEEALNDLLLKLINNSVKTNRGIEFDDIWEDINCLLSEIYAKPLLDQARQTKDLTRSLRMRAAAALAPKALRQVLVSITQHGRHANSPFSIDQSLPAMEMFNKMLETLERLQDDEGKEQPSPRRRRKH